jgi:hypothetical protein
MAWLPALSQPLSRPLHRPCPTPPHPTLARPLPSYLGWQIRLSDDDDTIMKAKDLHPKLAIGMTIFFILGGQGLDVRWAGCGTQQSGLAVALAPHRRQEPLWARVIRCDGDHAAPPHLQAPRAA